MLEDFIKNQYYDLSHLLKTVNPHFNNHLLSITNYQTLIRILNAANPLQF